MGTLALLNLVNVSRDGLTAVSTAIKPVLEAIR